MLPEPADTQLAEFVVQVRVRRSQLKLRVEALQRRLRPWYQHPCSGLSYKVDFRLRRYVDDVAFEHCANFHPPLLATR